MHPRYRIDDASQIISPALVVFREALEENLKQMIAIARGPEWLRPHCKTHKIRQIIEMELALGIDKHKCATFAEAEMLAQAGARGHLPGVQPGGAEHSPGRSLFRRNSRT
jgi:D-threonine aldolase